MGPRLGRAEPTGQTAEGWLGVAELWLGLSELWGAAATLLGAVGATAATHNPSSRYLGGLGCGKTSRASPTSSAPTLQRASPAKPPPLPGMQDGDMLVPQPALSKSPAAFSPLPANSHGSIFSCCLDLSTSQGLQGALYAPDSSAPLWTQSRCLSPACPPAPGHSWAQAQAVVGLCSLHPWVPLPASGQLQAPPGTCMEKTWIEGRGCSRAASCLSPPPQQTPPLPSPPQCFIYSLSLCCSGWGWGPWGGDP